MHSGFARKAMAPACGSVRRCGCGSALHTGALLRTVHEADAEAGEERPPGGLRQRRRRGGVQQVARPLRPQPAADVLRGGQDSRPLPGVATANMKHATTAASSLLNAQIAWVSKQVQVGADNMEIHTWPSSQPPGRAHHSQAVQRASSAQAALQAAASARRLARPGSITHSCVQFARCLGPNRGAIPPPN